MSIFFFLLSWLSLGSMQAKIQSFEFRNRISIFQLPCLVPWILEQVQSQSHGDLHYSKKPKQSPTEHVPQLHFILCSGKLYKRKSDIDRYFQSFFFGFVWHFEYETRPKNLDMLIYLFISLYVHSLHPAYATIYHWNLKQKIRNRNQTERNFSPSRSSAKWNTTE